MSIYCVLGKAGSGKTLLALAAGLAKTLDEGKYRKLLVSRPIFPMGRDIGYLPGDVEQKLNPWMQPIFDNVEFLMGAESSHKKAAGRAQPVVVTDAAAPPEASGRRATSMRNAAARWLMALRASGCISP